MQTHGTVAIANIDTRQLTRQLREHAAIVTSLYPRREVRIKRVKSALGIVCVDEIIHRLGCTIRGILCMDQSFIPNVEDNALRISKDSKRLDRLIYLREHGLLHDEPQKLYVGAAVARYVCRSEIAVHQRMNGRKSVHVWHRPIQGLQPQKPLPPVLTLAVSVAAVSIAPTVKLAAARSAVRSLRAKHTTVKHAVNQALHGFAHFMSTASQLCAARASTHKAAVSSSNKVGVCVYHAACATRDERVCFKQCRHWRHARRVRRRKPSG